MGKRFEGSEPTFMDMLAAYRLLGLSGLLGEPGEATAYATKFASGDCLEFSVLPGAFSAKEIAELREWAA